jgi:outer membrane receptor protein involved in Fe transport
MPARAAAQSDSNATTDADAEAADILVTGSRIRRTSTDTVAPVLTIDASDIAERGFVQAGDALNTVSSILPNYAAAPGNGGASGSGQQFPNLFGLGAGRTLTLLDGRRMVTTATGLGDRTVDTNVIPVGLIQRVDVVEAGGAAVYGSDAIAGVVNYVLKDSFDGLDIDAQGGLSTHGDYPRYAARATAGRNFDGGRGNIAVNAEWRKTAPLFFGSRKITQPVVRALANPLNTSATDGIPATAPVADPHFWPFNGVGVIARTPAPALSNLLAQFSTDGRSIASYDPGRRYVTGFNCAIPFCSGGDGLPYSEIASLYTGTETVNVAAIGHYDLTDTLRLSGQLLYARVDGTDPLGVQSPQRTLLGSSAAFSNPVAFTRANPFLTADSIAALTALSPTFGTGSPLYLSKSFTDLLPTRQVDYRTDVWRGDVSLDGKFALGDRKFYYSAAYSRAIVHTRVDNWAASNVRLTNALSATRNAAGQIVCAINAVAVVDAACVPVNPFGVGTIDPAARAYTTVRTGSQTRSTQDDLLVTLGGDIVKLPAGMLRFSTGYEHRAESARFTPALAAQRGLVDTGALVPIASGRFNTDELSGELLVPLVGGDVTLPLVRALEVSGQYRYVDNSLAGKENVWGVGVRWEVFEGMSLRGARSRNFRAPSLNQLLAPQTTALTGGVTNPCDTRYVAAGVAPTTRLAYCQALFAANPRWGALSAFTDPGVNNATVLVTSGGNPGLNNELSNTTSFGLAFQPRFVPGRLQVAIDRVKVKLDNGLTAFSPSDFANACADALPSPTAICATITRDPATGYILTALNTTFNAALVRYDGDIVNASYAFPLRWIAGSEAGELELAVDATHNRSLRTVVAGVTTEQAGSITAPEWVVRFDARYHIGPFRMSYQMYHLPSAKVTPTATIETTFAPIAGANTRHSVSMSYAIDRLELRAGIDNITDRQVSFPTYTYGSLLGRQIFVGAKVRY